MSESETFLSRWLRLKREAEAALPLTDASSPAAFDPTSLPSIESIVADTDIRQFLHESVPAELTRAALRSAWTADPAIRDFVGIAENQWDFNDHACIPGFGPLEAADYLVDRALGGLTTASQETAPGTEGTENAAAAQQPALPGGEPVEAVRAPPAPPVVEEAKGLAATTGGRETPGGETSSGAAPARSHGGALPR
jgi:Protein of unknown function (DUF3306)